MEMHSTHYEKKSVVAERFISNFIKNKIDVDKLGDNAIENHMS